MNEFMFSEFSPNIEKLRDDFPCLKTTNRGQPLVYLDTGATAQKPQYVLDSIQNFYAFNNANVHRGVYELSQRATDAFEHAREIIRDFIRAEHAHEIIFVRGATEGINLVAQSFGRTQVKAGDEILISCMEHHSNIVPWQMLANEAGAQLKIIPIFDNGEIDIESYKMLLNEKTKMVAVIHASNVLGTINPIKEMIQLAHEKNVPVLIDGAQALAHLTIDVVDLDCDFYVASSHKTYGPTGIGFLYGKTKHLESMPPYQTGGDMIETVSFEKTTFNKLPFKFEAGTPNMAGAVGFGTALVYLKNIGFEKIRAHEDSLLNYATTELSNLPGLQIIGTAPQKVGVISFVIDKIHPHDLGTILDDRGIAIRVGHHCAMPLMQRYNVPATARISFGLYNNIADIDAAIVAIKTAQEFFN